MTEPTQLPVTREGLEEVLEARRAALLDEVNALIAAAVAPLEAAIEEALKVGDRISLQASAGQFVSADGGGPNGPNLPMTFSSKADVHAWESFEIGKGQ